MGSVQRVTEADFSCFSILLGAEYFLGRKPEKKAPHWPPEGGE